MPLAVQRSDDEDGEGEGSEHSEDYAPDEDEDEDGSDEEEDSDDESLVDRCVLAYMCALRLPACLCAGAVRRGELAHALVWAWSAELSLPALHVLLPPHRSEDEDDDDEGSLDEDEEEGKDWDELEEEAIMWVVAARARLGWRELFCMFVGYLVSSGSRLDCAWAWMLVRECICL